jgi:multicomponent Na+:H+ antiporter subunit E
LDKTYLIRVAKLFVVYTLLWIVLSSAKFDFFAFGTVLFLSTLTPKLFTLQTGSFNIKAFALFVLFFIVNSFKGALQVSKLALSPSHCLSPFIYELPLRTRFTFTGVMLANVYSLMPGTVAIDIKSDTLTLHILDETLFDEAFLLDVQTRIIGALEKNG